MVKFRNAMSRLKALPTLLAFVSSAVLLACAQEPRVYLKRGDEFFAAERYKEAALQYEKALQGDPKMGEAAYKLGLTQIELGDGTEAYLALTGAVELMPDNIDAKVSLADLAVKSYGRGRDGHC